MILRVCKVCGLEARNDSELEWFKANKRSWFGREELCLQCSNKQGEAWREGHYPLKFKGRTVWLDHDPRDPVCGVCGFDNDLLMHHDDYDPTDVLAHTRTVCRVCHSTIHAELNREST